MLMKQVFFLIHIALKRKAPLPQWVSNLTPHVSQQITCCWRRQSAAFCCLIVFPLSEVHTGFSPEQWSHLKRERSSLVFAPLQLVWIAKILAHAWGVNDTDLASFMGSTGSIGANTRHLRKLTKIRRAKRWSNWLSGKIWKKTIIKCPDSRPQWTNQTGRRPHH